MFKELLPTLGAAAGTLELMLGGRMEIEYLFFGVYFFFSHVGFGYKAGVHIHSAWQ